MQSSMPRLFLAMAACVAVGCAGPRRPAPSPPGAVVEQAKAAAQASGGNADEAAAGLLAALDGARALPVDCRDGSVLTFGGSRILVRAPRALRFDRLIVVTPDKNRPRAGTMVREGAGVPAVARWELTPERRREHPFLSDAGYLIGVTVLLERSTSAAAGDLVLRVVDPLETKTVRRGGGSVAVAADFSAVGEFVVQEAERAGKAFAMPGLAAMRNSSRYLDKLGLIALEDPDPARIPLVFVHGLMSRPLTWQRAFNELSADPEIRKRYQPYFFRYPTGVPVLYSAGRFRENLAALDAALAARGAGATRERIVLVGHSMGGLVSKMQVTNSGDRLVKAFLGGPLSGLGLDREDEATLRGLLEFEANPRVGRVVFICTPHRGSRLAEGFVGSIGRRLIKLPFNALGQAGQAFGDLLRMDNPVLQSRLRLKGVPSSIDNLSPTSTFVQESVKLPFRPGLPLHSIVGNKEGRPLTDPKCSDGVVPYRSAHLDGVQSELVVRSDHGAHETPEGIAELSRILKLHLKAGK